MLSSDRRVLVGVGALFISAGFLAGVAAGADARALTYSVLALALAFLSGVWKRASPWGYNAAASLAAPSSGRGRRLFSTAFIAANALPAAIAWAGIGFLMASIGPHMGVAILALSYACAYGLIETQRLAVGPPTLGWQVPATWVRRERGLGVQTLVWGFILGPGLLTRNAYASIWLIPFVLAFTGNGRTALAVGALTGLAHGVGRAIGVLRNMTVRGPTSHVAVLGQYATWRSFDGLALFMSAGILASGLTIGF